jgi:ABC-type transporter MlaC component
MMPKFTKKTPQTTNKRPGAGLLTAALVLALHGGATALSTPSQVVDGLAGQVIPILQDRSLSSEQKRARIEQIAHEAMDFETLSKLVLARNLPKFSPAQRSEFTAEFERHLSVAYGRNVDNYKNEKVAIFGERPEQRGDVTVHTKILRVRWTASGRSST